MIFETASAYTTSSFKPKVCIVGSGPAGLSLALRLEKHKIPCVVLEAGGLDYSPDSQDFYRGAVVGDSYFELHIARLRQFGGTSGHWAGWCRPLDAHDFEPQPGVDKTGWPIRKADLDPFARDAEAILGLPPFPPDKPLNKDLIEIEILRKPPARFGTRYRDAVKNSALIALVLNSPVRQFVPGNGRIDHARVATAGGDLKVVADFFCACTGGIENSRLLLWSNEAGNGGVVPRAETLGRYWMEHPHHTTGRALVPVAGTAVHGGARFYAPTPERMRAQGIGNFGLRVFVGHSYARNLIKDGMCYAPEFFAEMARKVKAGLACGAEVHLAWEQTPLASNRVELDRNEKDAFGVPRTKLFWKNGERERKTAEVAMQLLGSYYAEGAGGRVKLLPWLVERLPFPTDDERAGFHHLGGTRMASSASDGVADAQCKVFGVDNLYVGGSSLFPTGGHTNPTYTIVQLALRLGDHLAQRNARS